MPSPVGPPDPTLPAAPDVGAGVRPLPQTASPQPASYTLDLSGLSGSIPDLAREVSMQSLKLEPSPTPHVQADDEDG